MRKFKTMIPIVVAMLIVALLAVACSPSNMTEDNDTVNAYFGALEAKTFNADDWTITSTGSLSNSLASVSASNFYWAYKATKQDDGNTTGQTEGFVNVVDGTGLNKSLTLSKGKWIFELKAYGSSESRATAISGGTDNYIYSGTSAELEFKTSGNIDVPLVYSTAEGNGKVSFNITATLSLDDVATEKGLTIEKIVAKLTPITGSTEKEITLTANGSNYTGSASDVPNGFYNVTCQIYIDGGVAEEKELSKLLVYKDMESAMSCTTAVTIKEETISAKLSNIRVSSVQCSTYGVTVVGEKGPAGGTVFYDAGSIQTSSYVDENGKTVEYQWRYLEYAPSFVSVTTNDVKTTNFVFGYYRPSGSNIAVVTNTTENVKIGAGRSNTRAIVNAMGKTTYKLQNPTDLTTTDKYAAKLADDYSVEYNGITYDDWFLPSKDEAEILSNCYLGLVSSDNQLWTSSEKNGTEVYYKNDDSCNSGKVELRDRYISCQVLPVRAFL